MGGFWGVANQEKDANVFYGQPLTDLDFALCTSIQPSIPAARPGRPLDLITQSDGFRLN